MEIFHHNIPDASKYKIVNEDTYQAPDLLILYPSQMAAFCLIHLHLDVYERILLNYFLNLNQDIPYSTQHVPSNLLDQNDYSHIYLLTYVLLNLHRL